MKKKQQQSHIRQRVGNKMLSMNNDHTLPAYYEKFPFYDRAIPRIAHKLREIDGHLTMIDVGANIGDTVSLVTDVVQGTFLCIEGDIRFLPFLKENTATIADSTVVIAETYIGDANSGKQYVEQTQSGTTHLIIAEEMNNNRVTMRPLDDVLQDHPSFLSANFLKIDTDGFEEQVLATATKFLREAQPAVFFEYTGEAYSDMFAIPDMLVSAGYDEALFYDNYGVPLKLVSLRDRQAIQALFAYVDHKNVHYYDVLAVPRSKSSYVSLIHTEMANFLEPLHRQAIVMRDRYDELVASHAESVRTFETATGELHNSIDEAKEREDKLRSQLNAAKSEIDWVYQSSTWKLGYTLQKFFRKVIPQPLRQTLKLGAWRLYTTLRRWHTVMLDSYTTLFVRPQKRIPRKADSTSRKILFIDHSFHVKTRSSDFFVEYLKQFYEVEILLDESWTGKQAPDLSFVDDSFYAVIFWQQIIPADELARIRNDNIIFIPMYDSARGLPKKFWFSLSSVKIISFSRTLHEKLVRYGLDSLYIQYFPEPQPFSLGDSEKAFFWQRRTELNIRHVRRLLARKRVSLHIHTAVDPYQDFIAPTRADESRMNITYSEWVPTKQDLRALMQDAALYIAPRPYEGIGLAFLEAMAMGKVVIAPNNPTMNEYIVDGFNGFLYAGRNPKPIVFKDIPAMQQQVYEYMQQGFAAWERNKHAIIEHIQKR